jgi:hypothetical protein
MAPELAEARDDLKMYDPSDEDWFMNRAPRARPRSLHPTVAAG